jgi:hypothetical protein
MRPVSGSTAAPPRRTSKWRWGPRASSALRFACRDGDGLAPAACTEAGPVDPPAAAAAIGARLSAQAGRFRTETGRREGRRDGRAAPGAATQAGLDRWDSAEGGQRSWSDGGAVARETRPTLKALGRRNRARTEHAETGPTETRARRAGTGAWRRPSRHGRREARAGPVPAGRSARAARQAAEHRSAREWCRRRVGVGLPSSVGARFA